MTWRLKYGIKMMGQKTNNSKAYKKNKLNEDRFNQYQYRKKN